MNILQSITIGDKILNIVVAALRKLEVDYLVVELK